LISEGNNGVARLAEKGLKRIKVDYEDVSQIRPGECEFIDIINQRAENLGA